MYWEQLAVNRMSFMIKSNLVHFGLATVPLSVVRIHWAIAKWLINNTTESYRKNASQWSLVDFQLSRRRGRVLYHRGALQTTKKVPLGWLKHKLVPPDKLQNGSLFFWVFEFVAQTSRMICIELHVCLKPTRDDCLCLIQLRDYHLILSPKAKRSCCKRVRVLVQ